MRNITQQEVDAIQYNNAPVPINVVFEFSGERFHRVASDNAHLHLDENRFLATNMLGDEISVFNINSIRVPEKKAQVVQKKRKKYKRPCNGVDYLEKIPFEYSKVKVGDKVELRNGNIATVDLLDDTTQPIHLKDGLWYKPNGEVNFTTNGYTNPKDILYILRKTKKSVPKMEQKKDEFRFVNEATGQEIVFSRDELQMIREIFGKVADHQETSYLSPRMILDKVWYKLCDAGFAENDKFVNNITLRPDTRAPLFKE